MSLHMKLAKLNRRELFLLMIAILAACFALFIYFVQPFLEKYDALNNSIDSMQTGIMKGKKYLDRNADQEACFITVINTHKAPLDVANISNVVIKDIGLFAKSVGLSLREIKPAYVDKEGDFLKAAVQLQIVGNLQNILDFIKKIENNDGLFVIEKAVLSQNKNGITLQMTLYRVYYAG